MLGAASAASHGRTAASVVRLDTVAPSLVTVTRRRQEGMTMTETLRGHCHRCGQPCSVTVKRGRIVKAAEHVDTERAARFHGQHAPVSVSWSRA